MSDIKNRVMLDDDAVEDVTGGNVLYVCDEVNHYCYGSHNPDVKYEFYSRRKMLEFINENYDYYGEAGIFNAMIEAGLIYRI